MGFWPDEDVDPDRFEIVHDEAGVGLRFDGLGFATLYLESDVAWIAAGDRGRGSRPGIATAAITSRASFPCKNGCKAGVMPDAGEVSGHVAQAVFGRGIALKRL